MSSADSPLERLVGSFSYSLLFDKLSKSATSPKSLSHK